MTYSIEALIGGENKSPTEFQPGARYFAPMDCVIYLKEDLSYRAARLSATLTVLLHPQREEAIGIKIKGVRFLVERLSAILKAAGSELTDNQKVSLLMMYEVALTNSDFGDQLLRDAEVRRQKILAARARELLKDAASLRIEEFELQAA